MNKKVMCAFGLFLMAGCNYLDGLEGLKDKPTDPVTYQEKTFSIPVPSDTFVYGYSEQLSEPVDHISVTSDGVAIPSDDFKLVSAINGIWFYHVSNYQTLSVTLYYVGVVQK